MGHAISETTTHKVRECLLRGCSLPESPGMSGFCSVLHRRVGRLVTAARAVAGHEVTVAGWDDYAIPFGDMNLLRDALEWWDEQR